MSDSGTHDDRIAPPGAGDAYPLGPRTSGSLAWWGTVTVVLALLSMLVTLLFTRVYLVGAGERTPPLLLPGLATAVLVASAVPTTLAHRAARSGEGAGRAVGSLAVAALLGAGFLALQAVHYTGLGLRVQTSAEDAAFAVTLAFHHLVALIGLAGLAIAALQLVSGPPRARNRSSVVAVALLWQTAVWSWPFLVAVLYLLPRWT